jgi:hypothetical protein
MIVLPAPTARAVLPTSWITVAFLAAGALEPADGGAAATAGNSPGGLFGSARAYGAPRAALAREGDRA